MQKSIRSPFISPSSGHGQKHSMFLINSERPPASVPSLSWLARLAGEKWLNVHLQIIPKCPLSAHAEPSSAVTTTDGHDGSACNDPAAEPPGPSGG